jgi:hypothetical protein
MFRKLLAMIESDAPSEAGRKVLHATLGHPHGPARLHAVDTTNPSVAAFTFHQGDQRAVAAVADHRISLPITMTTASINYLRPAIDPHAIGHFW